MRVLQLCNKMPFPAKDGYSVAVINIARALAAAGSEVAMLAMNTSRHRSDEKAVPHELKKLLRFRSVPVNNNISVPSALIKLLQNKSYHVSRFISGKFDKELQTVIKEFDPHIIQLEGLYLTPYIDTIRKNSPAKIVLRAHNAEYMVWKRNSEQEKKFVKKAYLKILAKQLKNYEAAALSRCDMIVSVSTIDEDIFKKMGSRMPLHVCPVTFDENTIPMWKGKPEKGTLFFIGSLDWLPNAEGLGWFLENVWKDVLKKYPGIKLFIAGRNTPAKLKNTKIQNVMVAGEVDNAYEFMRDKSIMLVPLFSGGGMRVKIIEGMALGKTIISTSIGAEGISYQDSEHLLIADDKAAFMEQISRCMEQGDFAERLGKNAAVFARQHYGSINAAKKLIAFYKQHLQ